MIRDGRNRGIHAIITKANYDLNDYRNTMIRALRNHSNHSIIPIIVKDA